MNINVRRIKTRYKFLFIIMIPLVFLYIARPRVIVHYSKEATEQIRLIWNTQHRIYKERIIPGQATADTGHIFPDKDFFMMFDWWTEKTYRRCINITPRWGRTIDIYLDETGRIDTAKTSFDVLDRLKTCDDTFRG
ncbi:hypothetical protein D3C75_874740 [compost metagenome]